MLRLRWLSILSLAALAGLATAGHAQLFVRAPFVNVRVGRPGVVVNAPFVNVEVQRGSAVMLPPPPPPVLVPTPTELPPPRILPPPVAPVAVRALTVDEFAAAFQPVAGTHEVLLVHPVTGCPVKVCFTLPEGCPRVRVHRRELEFDYGRREVEIHFRLGGRVAVDYD